MTSAPRVAARVAVLFLLPTMIVAGVVAGIRSWTPASTFPEAASGAVAGAVVLLAVLALLGGALHASGGLRASADVSASGDGSGEGPPRSLHELGTVLSGAVRWAFVAGIGAFVALLIAAGAVHALRERHPRYAFHDETAPPVSALWGATVAAVGRGLIVVVIVAVLGVALQTLVRRLPATLAIAGGYVLLELYLAGVPSIVPQLLAFVVRTVAHGGSSVMRDGPDEYLQGCAPDPAGTGCGGPVLVTHLSAAGGVLVLALVTAVVLALAAGRVHLLRGARPGRTESVPQPG